MSDPAEKANKQIQQEQEKQDSLLEAVRNRQLQPVNPYLDSPAKIQPEIAKANPKRLPSPKGLKKTEQTTAPVLTTDFWAGLQKIDAIQIQGYQQQTAAGRIPKPSTARTGTPRQPERELQAYFA